MGPVWESSRSLCWWRGAKAASPSGTWTSAICCRRSTWARAATVRWCGSCWCWTTPPSCATSAASWAWSTCRRCWRSWTDGAQSGTFTIVNRLVFIKSVGCCKLLWGRRADSSSPSWSPLKRSCPKFVLFLCLFRGSALNAAVKEETDGLKKTSRGGRFYMYKTNYLLVMYFCVTVCLQTVHPRSERWNDNDVRGRLCGDQAGNVLTLWRVGVKTKPGCYWSFVVPRLYSKNRSDSGRLRGFWRDGSIWDFYKGILYWFYRNQMNRFEIKYILISSQFWRETKAVYIRWTIFSPKLLD